MRRNLYAVLPLLLMLAASLPARAACTAGNPNASLAEATPNGDFTDNDDGTVTHAKTGLMWKQCVEGMSTDAASCDSGDSSYVSWAEALNAAVTANTAVFAGYSDWRLPNVKELESLIETCGGNPAINQTKFPATPSNWFWSSSTVFSSTAAAWAGNFSDGATGMFGKANTANVRLVRGGQTADAFDLFGSPSLSYGATTFTEGPDNDGSIATSVTITLVNDTFTGNNGGALGTVSNVPAGLTAVLVKASSTTATLSFTGNATAHANANDISNLTVTFANGDFTLGNAAAVTNATKNNLVIDFADPLPLLSATGVSAITGSSATLSATANVAATGYWIVIPRNATVPTAAEIKNGLFPGSNIVASGHASMTANVAKTFSVFAPISGTDYDLYIVAEDIYNNITAVGAPLQFTTAAAPIATSSAASSISASGATLNGSVNDKGATTTVSFDYGLTTGYGTNTAAATGGTVSAGSGSTAVAVNITGLACSTTYHFRVKGVNSVGTTNGSDQSFTTPACLFPPICSIGASPGKINTGGFSTLTTSCNPSATSYAWTNSGFGATVAGGTVSPTSSTTYSVTGSNADGTGNTASVTVAVLPSCKLTASPSTILAGASTNLSVSCSPAATSYTWTNSGFGSTVAGGSVSPLVTTRYSVIGSNADGSSETATVTVIVSQPADVRTYVPAAAAATGYTSFLRVINTGSASTAVTVALIDGVSGNVGEAKQLTATLAAGAAQTFSAQQIESALGVSLAASERPRIRVTGLLSNLDVQSLLYQPGNVYNDVTGAQSGSSVAVATYVPAAVAPFGYVSSLRIINTGKRASAVSVAKIDSVTGQTGKAGIVQASLPAGAAVTYTAAQVEAAIGAPIAASERPRILVSAVDTTLDVQSFLLQPGGAYTEVSSGQSGYVVDVRSYVPAAAEGYTSFLRVINSGEVVTPVLATLIDDTTGAALAAGTLVMALPSGAAMTFSSSQIESALGQKIAANSRPRIRVSSAGFVPSVLQVQSFLLQPNGAYNEISNAGSGTSVNVRTYIPAAYAVNGSTSYLRVINTGSASTALTLSLIDPVSGALQNSVTLVQSLPAGAAQTFSSAQIEAALGITLAAGVRPRIQVNGAAGLEVQSFLLQSGGAYTEVTGGQ